MNPELDKLAKLREPFAPNQISKLPKESRKQIDERKAGTNVEWKCAICGGAHHKNAVHLDYVGHAALTDRLLTVDPLWTWEPVGFTTEGLPAKDEYGGLWIKLTVCGVTRYGYGAADGKSGGDAVKEIIGDALRNAAMRFGAALDLWHKGDLHADEDEPKPATKPPKRPAGVSKDGEVVCLPGDTSQWKGHGGKSVTDKTIPSAVLIEAGTFYRDPSRAERYTKLTDAIALELDQRREKMVDGMAV